MTDILTSFFVYSSSTIYETLITWSSVIKCTCLRSSPAEVYAVCPVVRILEAMVFCFKSKSLFVPCDWLESNISFYPINGFGEVGIVSTPFDL